MSPRGSDGRATRSAGRGDDARGGRGPREAAERAACRRATWTFFWPLALGKLALMLALAAVVLAMHGRVGWATGGFVLLNWSWLFLAALLVAGPLAREWRLRRVRRKRAALIHAEWHVD